MQVEKSIPCFKKIYRGNTRDFYKLTEEYLKSKKKMFLVTANAEIFCRGIEREEIQQMLESDETSIIADGIGLVRCARMLGINLPEQITGLDLSSYLLDVCNKNHYKLCLLGAKEEVLVKFIDVIHEKYPNIELGYCEHGYTDDKELFFKKIKKEKPDVCLVALGIPIQEQWIYRFIRNYDKGIFIGVGQTFDVLSGTIKRAPKFFLHWNLEWLWRIARSPKRFKKWCRYNAKFVWSIWWHRKKLRKMCNERENGTK